MATDHDVAREVATQAGTLLLSLRSAAPRTGDGARELGAKGDRAAHDLILAALTRLRPDDAVLSEEGPRSSVPPEAGDGSVAGGRRRRWIVDPLDGTREYGEQGRTDWAVHVGLAAGDGSLLAGAVALPAQGRVLVTDAPPQMSPLPRERPRIVVSRTRPPEIAGRLADRLGGLLVPMGSAGAKAMAVVTGEAELYVHAGGQYVWDSCAPVAVAESAGCHASRLDGIPLRYDAADVWLPDLVICHPAIADVTLDALRTFGAEPAHADRGRTP